MRASPSCTGRRKLLCKGKMRKPKSATRNTIRKRVVKNANKLLYCPIGNVKKTFCLRSSYLFFDSLLATSYACTQEQKNGSAFQVIWRTYFGKFID